MQNADKFMNLLTLSEEERDQISSCINSICDNHSDDDWSQIYGKIFRWVDAVLHKRLADEAFYEEFSRICAENENPNEVT